MTYTNWVDGDYVLLVEGDLMLLATTQCVFQRCGYAVISCSTPEEAIAFCEKHPHARAVLSNVVFENSRLTGIDVAENVKRIAGGCTVLTCHHHPALLFGLHGFDEYQFLQQPFSSEQVVAVIAEAWHTGGRSRRRRVSEFQQTSDADQPHMGLGWERGAIGARPGAVARIAAMAAA